MIAIKGMEVPKDCHWDCPLCNEDGGACMDAFAGKLSRRVKNDGYRFRRVVQ